MTAFVGVPASRGGLPEGARGNARKEAVPFSARPAARSGRRKVRRPETNHATSPTPCSRFRDGSDRLLVAVLVTLSVVALTYAGVRYVIAGGDATGVEKAKGAAKSAVIGLTLALLAPVVVSIVKRIIGG